MTNMRLIRYRVTNFRSVRDSGWIETDDVTALIGTNESGKTNLLLPLWKLNPAKDGEINLLSDAPRKRYNEFKNMETKPFFIEAQFSLTDELVEELCRLTGSAPDDVRIVNVQKRLDPPSAFYLRFPNAQAIREVARSEVSDLLDAACDQLAALPSSIKAEDALKLEMLAAVTDASQLVQDEQEVTQSQLKEIKARLAAVDTEAGGKRSALVPRYLQLIDALDALIAKTSKPLPHASQEARKLVIGNLPKFVYYSNYGNLDSEIYLPHVIENMKRTDLGSREAARARTLKVLFEFVRLEPEEILELGRDIDEDGPRPTQEKISEIAEHKREREVLLQSASTDLTQKFRDWWKQGNHQLRFQADGAHFRIWVRDEVRPEEIELEGRSTGLQWFLSFYLIFLVESQDAHEGAILLLDEPGASLHPIAQKDLSRFFANLAQSNQLIYTTHSPFLVDPDHLDRVRSVYVDPTGETVASPNLRASEKDFSQTNSIYAVHAAIGLSVSDMLLQGCLPVIVEGQSDQFYLSAIKTLLIGANRISPQHELIFVPSGGAKGITAVAPIVAAKEEQLPIVLLDSDKPGKDNANRIRSGLYQGAKDRVLLVGDFIHVPEAEMEDLIPSEAIAWAVNRSYRGEEEEFGDIVRPGEAIIPQIESFAEINGYELKEGWKVELARQTKTRLLRQGIDQGPEDFVKIWQRLFERFLS